MSRRVLGLDRLVALLAGIVLIALGAGIGAWGLDRLQDVWAAAPTELHLQTAKDAFAASWWAWASGIAGVVLALLGLWWLLAHVPRRSTGPLRLDGSGKDGALRLDGDSAADVAAEVLAETPGVRSASGRVLRDRGEQIAQLDVTAEPTADLALLGREIDRVSAELRSVIGRDDLRGRVRVHVARRAKDQSRVR